MEHDWVEKLIDMLSDPIRQAEAILHEKNRTDPWSWYCRICGATGEHTTRPGRDAQAMDHVVTMHWHSDDTWGQAEAGHLLHIWCYPRWADEVQATTPDQGTPRL
jgi:hypothetical protein